MTKRQQWAISAMLALTLPAWILPALVIAACLALTAMVHEVLFGEGD